jgi:hypothetical protein
MNSILSTRLSLDYNSIEKQDLIILNELDDSASITNDFDRRKGGSLS